MKATHEQARNSGRMAAEFFLDARGVVYLKIQGVSSGILFEYILRYTLSVSHLIIVDTAQVFNYGEDIMHNAIANGATTEMLEALAASSSTEEAMKSTLKLIFPLYFSRYQPAYDALLADIIVCAALEGHQEQMLSTYNTLPSLHDIGCPTLLLVGRDHFICP